LDWSVRGFAADPPTASDAFADAASSQLVQAMAGFGDGGAANGLNVPAAFGPVPAAVPHDTAAH
jgi:hypothetical protein